MCLERPAQFARLFVTALEFKILNFVTNFLQVLEVFHRERKVCDNFESPSDLTLGGSETEVQCFVHLTNSTRSLKKSDLGKQHH